MLRNARLSIPALAAAALAVAAATPALPALGAGKLPVSFQQEVKPILERRCVECHRPGGDGYEASGLDLTSYEGVMTGTKFGPMVVPGQPYTSNLAVLLEGRAAPELRMPHDQVPVRDCYVHIIKQWIAEGAKNN